MDRSIAVWDLPTRIFHWSLVLLVAGSFISGKIGGNAMLWHGTFGVAILGLLSFRLIWGLVGSTYARFTTFVRGPAAVLAYLRGDWQGLGHNPLGALSVLAMLGLLLFQACSGLIANDDIAFNGPLYPLVSKDDSDRATGLHRQSEILIITLVALHLAAIGFYARVKKQNLVRPMVTGLTESPESNARPASGGGPVAFVIAVVVALVVVWAASGGLLPPPPPPPPAPAW
ncbi:MAG: cytochrome b/b6 domain-containing protein [Rhodocyclaceae bacterium]|nr:cytochrome b/b6 domain-containing protein [Rhodocyclaceae bacterium]